MASEVSIPAGSSTELGNAARQEAAHPVIGGSLQQEGVAGKSDLERVKLTLGRGFERLSRTRFPQA